MTAGDRLLEAYPLTWPEGQQRTPPGRRKIGHFKIGFGRTRDELLEELGRLGAKNVIISSNVPTRRDGLPYADARELQDPGIAVYFERRGHPYVFACDSYGRVAHNLRAVGLTIEALRAIERHGASQMMEQAFRGFTALPAARAAEPSWWEVLGVTASASTAEIRARYRELARQHHPDMGGAEEMMSRLNRAYDAAMSERGEACAS